LNRWLEWLGGFSARRHWIVIIGWVLILAGLAAANSAFGGDYVNNYNVPGTESAAAIMIVVFTSFVLSTDPTVKMLAIGMAFAVLIDASLVRLILVPSVMTLLGARAWYMPRWMEPIVPHLQLEGSTAQPET
jgi:uncharacterized membrane protein YdfJ with MMPL/SSD domain